MAIDYASAIPHKRFFLEMFTRDISLHDCILDLIDNSIDGFIRSHNIDLDIAHLLAWHEHRSTPTRDRAPIVVKYNGTFTIDDKSGGIGRDLARTEVFTFGHSDIEQHNAGHIRLGAYGIGLKRAIFKIGNHFEMISRTPKEGFRVTVNVNEWSQKDESPTDWRFPMELIDGAGDPADAGTTITISDLHDDIKALFADRTIESVLHRSIGQTYAPFLSRYVSIELNEVAVDPIPIPLGASKDFKPAVETWEEDGVRITLLASVATRGASNEWKSELAGWYAICNGRIIVAADKTELTGWGAGILPQFHSSKARGFVGIASFSSTDPLKLPWTTTKRSLNRESSIFLRVRERMATIARPVYSFLESLYASKTDVTTEERQLAKNVTLADMGEILSASNAAVSVKKGRRKKTTTKVQYEVENSELELIREHLRQNTAASTIGRLTFEYFLEQEGLK